MFCVFRSVLSWKILKMVQFGTFGEHMLNFLWNNFQEYRSCLISKGLWVMLPKMWLSKWLHVMGFEVALNNNISWGNFKCCRNLERWLVSPNGLPYVVVCFNLCTDCVNGKLPIYIHRENKTMVNFRTSHE